MDDHKRQLKTALVQSDLHGYVESTKGLKKTNEDRASEAWVQGVGTFYGLFDGHGGSSCAEFAEKHMHSALETELRRLCPQLAAIDHAAEPRRKKPRLDATNNTSGDEDAPAEAGGGGNDPVAADEAADAEAVPAAEVAEVAEAAKAAASGGGSGWTTVRTRADEELEDAEEEDGDGRQCVHLTDKELTVGFQEAFRELDARFLALAERKGLTDGSTALCLLVHGNVPRSSKLVVANAGDCRAVLCRGGRAVPLSRDHKPDRPDEKRRIEALGGAVCQVGGVWRVTSAEGAGVSLGAGRPALYLAVSRALGDASLKRPQPLVSSQPEVRVE